MTIKLGHLPWCYASATLTRSSERPLGQHAYCGRLGVSDLNSLKLALHGRLCRLTCGPENSEMISCSRDGGTLASQSSPGLLGKFMQYSFQASSFLRCYFPSFVQFMKPTMADGGRQNVIAPTTRRCLWQGRIP
jgi:hypothetical protein